MSIFAQGQPVEAVLTYIIYEDEVLLAKKLQKIGIQRWNGYGGKVEPGESYTQAALREVYVETGGIRLTERDLELAAVVDCANYYDFEGESFAFGMRVRVYIARVEKLPRARKTAEMGEPALFPVTELPYREMIPTDIDWLPHIFAGRKIYVAVYLGPQQSKRIRRTEILPLEKGLLIASHHSS